MKNFTSTIPKAYKKTIASGCFYHDIVVIPKQTLIGHLSIRIEEYTDSSEKKELELELELYQLLAKTGYKTFYYYSSLSKHYVNSNPYYRVIKANAEAMPETL